MPTCVTCIGFVGVEIVGLRGLLLTPLSKLANMLFFFPSGLASSEYRCRGDTGSPFSLRGGEMRSILVAALRAAKLWLARSFGLRRRSSKVLLCDSGVGMKVAMDERGFALGGDVTG